MGILAVQITFKWGLFMLEFKCFKLENLFGIPFCLNFWLCCAQNECFLLWYHCWQIIMANTFGFTHFM
jgi:hypothetical protein